MDILSIGNSFSSDAQRYLHQIAKADGFNLNCFNLYIGGCSLYTHYSNMQSDQRAYTLEMNGASTGFKVSLKEALLNREWDIITIQQVSTKSVNYETYQPYLNEIISYVKKMTPKAKIALHQTWAYEQGSERITRYFGHTDQKQMFNDLKAEYDMAAKDIKADFIIPYGEVFQNLISILIDQIAYYSNYVKLY